MNQTDNQIGRDQQFMTELRKHVKSYIQDGVKQIAEEEVQNAIENTASRARKLVAEVAVDVFEQVHFLERFNELVITEKPPPKDTDKQEES